MRSMGLLLMLAAVALAPAEAAAADRAAVERGRTVARQVCAACHAVEVGLAPSPNPRAPSFRTIATTPGMTEAGLYGALRTPHGGMPSLVPDPADRDDVIAYLRNLLPPE
jgi:mono/diheme cytochrome c family protein